MRSSKTPPTMMNRAGDVDDSGQPRDARGRWASKDGQPGEAAAESHPALTKIYGTPAAGPAHPARASGEQRGTRQLVSAQDRQTFQALPQQAQEFLLRRHSEMEGDYQRRVQAASGAVQFAQALAPVFSDPVIAGSLQQSGVAPLNAIEQWAGFHRRAMDPNPQVRSQLLGELADRMGLVNPATDGQSAPTPALSPQDLQDPVIRHFADTLGRALNETQTLRGEIQRMQSQTAEQRQAESLRATRWTVDQLRRRNRRSGPPLAAGFRRGAAGADRDVPSQSAAGHSAGLRGGTLANSVNPQPPDRAATERCAATPGTRTSPPGGALQRARHDLAGQQSTDCQRRGEGIAGRIGSIG